MRITYGENLPDILKLYSGPTDLIIGKQSLIKYEAQETNTPIRPLALLTDKNGSTDLWGLFVVRGDDPAQSIADLKDYQIIFGPRWESEKHTAALTALRENEITVSPSIPTLPSCNAAALAVVENEADVAVISSYALALLEGCSTIDKGSLRVVGKTRGVPFVTVFATNHVNQPDEKAIRNALASVKNNPDLLKLMESKSGFIPLNKYSNPHSQTR